MSKKTLFISLILALFFSFSCQHYSRQKACCGKKAKAGLKSCCAKKARAGLKACCGAGSGHAGQADVLSVDSSPVKGTVFFESAGDFKIKVSASFTGLKANKNYGFHIHEFGLCGNKALLAGAHLSTYGSKKHGGPTSTERHLGDLGNLQSDSKGNAIYSAVVPGKVKKVLGRSIIVHAGEDDLKTQPSGKSGARIACGVIVAVMPPVVPSVSSVEEKGGELVPASDATSSPAAKPAEEEEPLGKKKTSPSPPTVPPSAGDAAAGPVKAIKKQEVPVEGNRPDNRGGVKKKGSAGDTSSSASSSNSRVKTSRRGQKPSAPVASPPAAVPSSQEANKKPGPAEEETASKRGGSRPR